MAKDLNLVGYRFNWALSIFYIVYLLVEVPSNVILKKVGPRFYLPLLVVGFGFVSMCTAFVHNFDQLCVARAFLGLFEGGAMPGFAWYLSSFYTRKELYFRVGIYVSSASMAVSLSTSPLQAVTNFAGCFWWPSGNRSFPCPSLGYRVDSHSHMAQYLLLRGSSHDSSGVDCTVDYAFKS